VDEFSVDFSLDLSELLEGIQQGLFELVDHAHRAGLDTTSVTAPDWTVRQLLAHQGMVHRWADALVRGGRKVDSAAFEAEGLAAADPVEWVREGGLRLIDTLHDAPDDLQAPVFLNDPPASPKLFWARRQCHETTIHAVDALSASLGRFPTAVDTVWITREVAVDGIDELLAGFLTRPANKLHTASPTTVSVRPTDMDDSWRVHLGEEPAVVERGTVDQHPLRFWKREHTDVVLEATSVTLYLALWNRSDEVTADGFGFWRENANVTWA
jgi:uncharacterized protein (TIGR03083 family)